jgi:very-short-patch-repair endonuclease
MHGSRQHGIESKLTYDEYILNGETPKCTCGCGEVPKYLSADKGYRDFIRGHAARVNNNWGHNPDAHKKSKETQKKMYKSGELTIWNKGLTLDDPRVKDNIEKMLANPNRNRKISKSLKGIKRSDEYKKKMSESQKKSWADPIKREKQRLNRMEYFKNKQFNKKSKLEQRFENLLVKLDIKFENQKPVNGYLFDFYIPNINTLIEIDGDWYHFNERVHSKPLSPIQENTMKNDKIKNKLAEEYGYNLIRFWEYDINNNLYNVINTLKLLI